MFVRQYVLYDMLIFSYLRTILKKFFKTKPEAFFVQELVVELRQRLAEGRQHLHIVQVEGNMWHLQILIHDRAAKLVYVWALQVCEALDGDGVWVDAVGVLRHYKLHALHGTPCRFA